MLKIILNRLKQGRRTLRFPGSKPPAFPSHYRGRPLAKDNGEGPDMGKVLYAPDDNISYTQDYRMAASKLEDLIIHNHEVVLARSLGEKMRKLLGRSLKLRHVSAGGCNACEADLNVLNTVVFDLSRFGIQFVASPRHADGLIVTGPVPRNMREALIKTYEAMPEPKIVIAVGSCAISGGVFADGPEESKGITDIIPVDLYIPGCPPHPLTTLDGLLRLLGRIKNEAYKT